jgi:hypothetical protein
MSDYFDASSSRISDGLTARAADVNTLRDQIGAGFDKLPSEDDLKKGTTNYAVDTGAADAYVVTLDYPPAAYTDGMLLVFKAAHANTGASTVNVNALGVKALKRQNGNALVADDIVADKIFSFRYNSTSGYFELQEKGYGITSTVSGISLGSTGTDAVAIGVTSPGNGATGTANIAIGSYAGQNNSGNGNISIGDRAMSSVAGASTGDYNIAIGSYALGGGASVGSHEKNIAIGRMAGVGIQTGASKNTIIGDNSALHTGILTGSNNILLGADAEPTTSSASNAVTLGNSSISVLRCQVTSITSLSDARDKTDVAPLTAGLSTVMALNPVRFTWDMRDGGKVGIKDSGFIAQELQAVDDDWLRLVYAENPEKLEASYGRLIPVLVKAIQELKSELDAIKSILNQEP